MLSFRSRPILQQRRTEQRFYQPRAAKTAIVQRGTNSALDTMAAKT